MLNIILLACALSSDTTNPPTPPDISKWQVVGQPELLEPRGGDYQREILGIITTYQNPADKSEYAEVYTRHIAIMSERAKEFADPTHGRSPVTPEVIDSYHRQQELQALERVQKATDTFAVIIWQTSVDRAHGVPVLQGDAHYWLLDQGGTWFTQDLPVIGALKRTPVSEPLRGRITQTVVVGIEFTLGPASHTIRVEQSMLALPAKNKEKSRAR